MLTWKIPIPDDDTNVAISQFIYGPLRQNWTLQDYAFGYYHDPNRGTDFRINCNTAQMHAKSQEFELWFMLNWPTEIPLEIVDTCQPIEFGPGL